MTTTTISKFGNGSATFERELPSGRRAAVSVFRTESFVDDSVTWQVNWSALGSVSTADALAYAGLLAEAGEYAEAMQEGRPVFDPAKVRTHAETLWAAITDTEFYMDIAGDIAADLAAESDLGLEPESDESADAEMLADDAIHNEIGRFFVDTTRWTNK